MNVLINSGSNNGLAPNDGLVCLYMYVSPGLNVLKATIFHNSQKQDFISKYLPSIHSR